MFIDNLRVDVIATYKNHEQELFSCGVWKSAIKSEKKLIDYIKKQLTHKDLIKLLKKMLNIFFKITTKKGKKQ